MTLGDFADRLRTLTEAESPSGDRERIRVALDLLDDWGSDALGRRGRLVTVDGVDHLLWPATERPSVLVLGHVDTVWPAGTLASWPCTVEGGTFRGPGAFDMKAGLVVGLAAIERADLPAHVAMLVTSDEEVGSTTSRALIERVAGTASAALVVEPSLDGALKTSRLGTSLYRLVFDGVEAHAGLDPARGANALVELAHQVLSLRAVADSAAGTLVTPTVASAGTTANTVPGRAELRIDVRARSLGELARVDDCLAALRPVDPRVTVTVEGGVNRPPLEEHHSRQLFALARDVAATEGLDAPAAASAGGASDGNFTAALGIPTLDGLGPAGGGAHARTEWVSLDSMHDRAALIAGIIDAVADGRGGRRLG